MKKVIRIAGILAIIIILLLALSWILRPYGTDASMNKIKAFQTVPEDSLEVIAYGSSRVWRGIDPLEMYESYGLAAYNYGCNWQRANTTQLFVHDSLRKQTPKVALIETRNINAMKRDTDIDGEIFYTKAITLTKAKLVYLKQCFARKLYRYASYLFPIAAFHDNWSTFVQGQEHRGRPVSYYQSTMGMDRQSHSKTIEVPKDYAAFPQKELQPGAIAVLDDIVSTLQEKGTEVIFYVQPCGNEYAYLDAMTEYCESRGCQFINGYACMEEIGLDEQTDFCDRTHLNVEGAKKMSRFLAKYITDRYTLTDMRTKPGNMWENGLQTLQKTGTQTSGEEETTKGDGSV